MTVAERRQFYRPYESTVEFEKFLKKNKCLNSSTSKILDVGTGIGSNLQYFSKMNKKINFLGIDYNQEKIAYGAKLNKNYNIKLKKKDVFKLPSNYFNKFDGLIMIHTLICFKKIDKIIKKIKKINPKWVGINSLFYPGNLDVLIHIRDYDNIKIKDNNPDGDFNIFSLKQMKKKLKSNGYKIFKIKKYFPSKKLKKAKNGSSRGSYTIKSEINNYTTFTGPVYLPWYFLIIKKIND